MAKSDTKKIGPDVLVWRFFPQVSQYGTSRYHVVDQKTGEHWRIERKRKTVRGLLAFLLAIVSGFFATVAIVVLFIGFDPPPKVAIFGLAPIIAASFFAYFLVASQPTILAHKNQSGSLGFELHAVSRMWSQRKRYNVSLDGVLVARLEGEGGPLGSRRWACFTPGGEETCRTILAKHRLGAGRGMLARVSPSGSGYYEFYRSDELLAEYDCRQKVLLIHDGKALPLHCAIPVALFLDCPEWA